jgi:hypothetical protein
VQVYDKHGVDISDDRISFATYLLSGKGRCGTVGPHADITDGAGTVDVTYRASRFNVACVIVATDALGGKSGSAVVYQGTKRSIAPRAGDKFPARIIAGRRAGFTTSFRNPMRNKISGAQASFAIYSAGSHPPNVRARQVHVSVSFHRYRGPFVPVRLTGSTGEAGITGVIGRAAGFTFRARHKLTLTYRIRVSRHVPRRRHGPIFQFQAYLGQVNPASGGDTALTETRTVDVKVR